MILDCTIHNNFIIQLDFVFCLLFRGERSGEWVMVSTFWTNYVPTFSATLARPLQFKRIQFLGGGAFFVTDHRLICLVKPTPVWGWQIRRFPNRRFLIRRFPFGRQRLCFCQSVPHRRIMDTVTSEHAQSALVDEISVSLFNISVYIDLPFVCTIAW